MPTTIKIDFPRAAEWKMKGRQSPPPPEIVSKQKAREEMSLFHNFKSKQMPEERINILQMFLNSKAYKDFIF